MAKGKTAATRPGRRVVTTETFEDDPSRAPNGAAWAGGPPDDIDEQLAGDDEELMRRALEGLDDGEIKIKVFRITATGKDYCFTTTPPVDEDFIQEAYGGGRYEVKFFVNGSYRKALILGIAERKASAAAGNGAMADDRVLSMMRDQMAELRAELREARRAPVQAPMSLKEMAEALVLLHGIGGGGGGGGNAAELILKGVELGKSVSGKDGDDWIGLVRDALPVVGGFMNARNGGASGIRPVNSPNNFAENPQKTLPGAESDALIRQGLEYLKSKGALRGADPLLFVDMALLNANEPEYQPIIQFALQADVAALAAIDPAIGAPPLSTWFQQFLDGLRSAIVGGDPVDGDTGGPTGDGGNAPANVGAGKGGSKKRKPA